MYFLSAPKMFWLGFWRCSIYNPSSHICLSPTLKDVLLGIVLSRRPFEPLCYRIGSVVEPSTAFWKLGIQKFETRGYREMGERPTQACPAKLLLLASFRPRDAVVKLLWECPSIATSKNRLLGFFRADQGCSGSSFPATFLGWHKQVVKVAWEHPFLVMLGDSLTFSILYIWSQGTYIPQLPVLRIKNPDLGSYFFRYCNA